MWKVSENHVLKEQVTGCTLDILQLKTHFQPFMKLSGEDQSTLYEALRELLLHEETVTQLEDVLDNIHLEGMLESLVMKELKLPERKSIEEFLQLMGISLQEKPLRNRHQDQALLLAAHILLSALAELSDYALVLLWACCDLQVVPALCCLPDMTSLDGTLTLADPVLAPLTDVGRFHLVQRLFASSNINLEMTESSIRAITMKKPQFLPIVIYIALYGFCALGWKTELQ
uniref:Uncharacterized protein n=1 Tax=Sphaerodactylus townsendi TaxID=933632 RepID=A0ACB8FUP2_9SAUR